MVLHNDDGGPQKEPVRPLFSDLRPQAHENEDDSVSVGDSVQLEQGDMAGDGAGEHAGMSGLGDMGDMDEMYTDEDEPTQPLEEVDEVPGESSVQPGPVDMANARALRNRVVSKTAPLTKSRSKSGLPSPSTLALERKVDDLNERVTTLQATVKELGVSVRELQRGMGEGTSGGVGPGALADLRNTVDGLERASRVITVTLEQQVHPVLKSHVAFVAGARATIDGLKGDVAGLMPLKATTSAYGERLLRIELAGRGAPAPVVPSKRALEQDLPLFSFHGPDGPARDSSSGAPSRPFVPMPSSRPSQSVSRGPGGPQHASPTRSGGLPPPVTAPNSLPSLRRPPVNVLVRIGPVDTKGVGERAALVGWLNAAQIPVVNLSPSKQQILDSIEAVYFSAELTHLMVRLSSRPAAYDLAHAWNTHVKSTVPLCAGTFAETVVQGNGVE